MVAKFLRVNMSDGTVTQESPCEQYKHLGGRALTSRIVADEVAPTCHPLGPSNKVVLAPGLVTGTHAPSSGRISVGAKSPLTGGIKESNAGTPFSQQMGRMQIKALIIEGQAEEGFWLLVLDESGLRLQQADDLAGMGMSDVVDTLTERFGEHAGVMGIGPAGEMKMSMAGICFNDNENRASRYSGRGGLGAVLGAKGVKALVIDDTDAPGVEIKDQEMFRQGTRKLSDALREHEVTRPGGTLNSYGTAALINVLSEAGGLPVCNFSGGTYEEADDISGETIARMIEERGGEGMTGHSCHPGCIIQCSNVWPKEDGSEHVSVIEYESDWALGANLGISDLDAIAEMIRLCNDIGVDTIETGVTLGVAMEAGVAEFGDADRAIELIKEIGEGTPLGRILGQGAEVTGRVFGVTRVPTVKGQGMPAYEPRAVKGIGITYATTPMGADHTAGYTIGPEILAVGGEEDPLSPEGKAEISRDLQVATAFLDSTGYCLFTAFAILDIDSGFEGMVESVAGVLGTDWTADDATSLGEDVLDWEREFNRQAGFTRADDRLPEFMKLEKLPPHNQVYDVTDEELDRVHGE